MLYSLDDSFDMAEQIWCLVYWCWWMIERTDERRVTDVNYSNPQHLKHRSKNWNRTVYAGGKRATRSYRNTTALAAGVITSISRIFRNLDNAVCVVLFNSIVSLRSACPCLFSLPQVPQRTVLDTHCRRPLTKLLTWFPVPNPNNAFKLVQLVSNI